MNQVDKKYLILGSLCALVLMLVVGYAAFSTILNIKGTSNISSNWDVKITGIELFSSKGATDNEGSPSYDNTNGLSATFNTNFTTPGDYATYKIEITNNGSLDAKLINIDIPENTNNDILFYLNKNQNNEDITESLKQNDTLFKAGETGNVGYVYVTVLYRDYENQKTPTKENATVNMTITFDFEEADGSGSNTPVEPEEPGFTGTIYRGAYTQPTGTLNIGDSIKGLEIVTDVANLDTDDRYYLKHEVENNIIKSVYVCFNMSTLVCLQGGNPDYYASNKTILQSQKAWVDSLPSGVVQPGCGDYGTYYSCTIGRQSYADANSDGSVSRYDNNDGCYITAAGASHC